MGEQAQYYLDEHAYCRGCAHNTIINVYEASANIYNFARAMVRLGMDLGAARYVWQRMYEDRLAEASSS